MTAVILSFGTGDFTVVFCIRANANVTANVIDFRNPTISDVAFVIYRSGGVIFFRVGSVEPQRADDLVQRKP